MGRAGFPLCLLQHRNIPTPLRSSLTRLALHLWLPLPM
jgi:hypothetical protein